MKGWSIASASVQGASHIKRGTPNQDALRVLSTENFSVIALSDGHGSASCIYSDEGAEAAVEVVCEVFQNIFSVCEDHFHTISVNKDVWLPKQIEQRWKIKVSEIHRERLRELPDPDNFPHILYGATLLTLVITNDFIFALQLGDGDILLTCVDEKCLECLEAEKCDNCAESNSKLHVDWVIPPDATPGPATNSLCQEECWQYVNTRIIPLENSGQIMFLLATDGYANSFYTNTDFKQAGADFYNLFKEHGLEYVQKNLPNWLEETGTKGSGDDISMAIIFN
ncbi:MAG: protein phosphatase 2C domain-containing protein [Turicibacter sp.]|nr:protein phosphatase 2C domain-containing protein [Turicibacter sp.]